MITNLSIGHNGRLGNQIFQYAILKCISFQNNYQVVLPKENTEKIATGRFNPSINDVDRYKLDLLECFDISDQVLSISEIAKNLSFQYEENFTMDYNPNLISNAKDGTNYVGFYQCVQYYYQNEEKLKKILAFKQHIKNTAINYINQLKNEHKASKIITTHIRRGDLSLDNGQFQVLLSSQYYNKIFENLKNENTKFLIVSDDIEWCKNNFHNKDIIFCDLFDDKIQKHILDFCILSCGDNIIMSNSSFSWWAAWLSDAKDVFCPNKWFGPVYSNFHEENMRHYKWKQINVENI
jgi:hypothetical protein